MSLERLHVATFSICPDPESGGHRAENMCLVGDTQRQVWEHFHEIYFSLEDREFNLDDIWVLSFDVLMDWQETPPFDPETGEYSEEDWWDPYELIDSLQEVVSQDTLFLGPSKEGRMTDDDVERNALWMAGSLLDREAPCAIGVDVFDPRCEPYAVWRARLYRGRFDKAS